MIYSGACVSYQDDVCLQDRYLPKSGEVKIIYENDMSEMAGCPSLDMTNT